MRTVAERCIGAYYVPFQTIGAFRDEFEAGSGRGATATGSPRSPTRLRCDEQPLVCAASCCRQGSGYG